MVEPFPMIDFIPMADSIPMRVSIHIYPCWNSYTLVPFPIFIEQLPSTPVNRAISSCFLLFRTADGDVGGAEQEAAAVSVVQVGGRRVRPAAAWIGLFNEGGGREEKSQ